MIAPQENHTRGRPPRFLINLSRDPIILFKVRTIPQAKDSAQKQQQQRKIAEQNPKDDYYRNSETPSRTRPERDPYYPSESQYGNPKNHPGPVMYINTDVPGGEYKHSSNANTLSSDQLKGPLVIGNLFGNISLTPEGKIKNYDLHENASVNDSKDRLFLTPDAADYQAN